MTREQWLEAGIEALREHFKECGYPLPDTVRVSVGFPRARRKAVGQCWKGSCSKDGTNQIFISPVHTDGVSSLDTLAHELAHAALDCVGNHGAKFTRVCRAVGLTKGKPTSASAGPELLKRLNSIAKQLGEYPHSPMSFKDQKKQTTRLLKVECASCGYVARVTAKWLEAMGAPLCPCNQEVMQ